MSSGMLNPGIRLHVAVGKTSLIKALTGEQSMQPRDQLFATLDVTMHAGRLPNSVVVLYADTIGFISDIPTDLIESFAAVLEDVNNAVKYHAIFAIKYALYLLFGKIISSVVIFLFKIDRKDLEKYDRM